MPRISQCLRIRSKLTELKKLDNNLVAFSTNLHGAKLFSYEECNVSLSIYNEYLDSFTSSVSFSPNGEFIAFSVKSTIYIMHIQSKIIIKTIKSDKEIIELIEFDLESKYIIATTKSGRILQYRYDGSSLLARLYSFKVGKSKNDLSTVSALAFNKNIMAAGGDNGTIFTINLHSRTNKYTIINDTVRINSICFLNDSLIASGDSKGNIYFNSLKKEKLIKKIQSGFTKITQIVLMPIPNYIAVTGDSNYISIYDITNFKLLHNKYIEFDDVIDKTIVLDDHTLLVALKNGSIEKLELPNPSQLKTLTITNSFDKAYALVKKDSMLKGAKEYKELEDAYDNIYNQALELLVNQNKDKALKLTSLFKYVDEKKKDIELLFKAFENYPKFKSLYMEKKHHLAYAFSSKFPPLTKTFQYMKMEEKWKDTFKNAQRQIAHGKMDNAKTLLNEYITVAQKRPIIKLILNHNKEFIQFLKAIESKNFQTIHKIAKSNELFTKIPTYKGIKDEMLKAVEDIQRDIEKCDLDSAIKKISKLEKIDSIAEHIAIQKNECRAISKLQEAYEQNNFIKCFEILDKHSSLNNTELGALLQKHWNKIISECESFALKGNIKNIKEILGKLISLSTRRDKIGDLFRLSFHTKIKGLIAKKAYNSAQSIIYSYIDIFGLDNEIISIMGLYERVSKSKLAITYNQNNRQTRDSWINSDVIMGS